jgi:hypothetical protein
MKVHDRASTVENRVLFVIHLEPLPPSIYVPERQHEYMPKAAQLVARVADCCYFVLCCVAAAVRRMRGQGLGAQKKRKILLIVIGVVSSICCAAC